MTDNPSAFPSEGEGHGNPRYHSPGMTLRDWFAGQAGLVTRGMLSSVTRADEAYAVADAMLAARAANQGN